MGYINKAIRYGKNHGKKALLKKIISVLTLRNKPVNLANENIAKVSTKAQKLSNLIDLRFSQLRPLKIFSCHQNISKRMNLVTDSINSGSLFGGVITSIIYAFLLAKKNNASIRIITRTEKAEEYRIKEILDHYEIKFDNDINFVFAHFADTNKEIDVIDEDYFITTSWWTTYATMQSIRKDKIFYLLQEDERMFYPYGDDRLLCEETIANEDIHFLINSKLLYEHLINSGFDNIRARGRYFEPSFDTKNYFWEKNKLSLKKKLFFYARPNNMRNLFYRGINVLQLAVDHGVIDSNIWDIYFVGKDLPKELEFDNSYKIKVVTDLTYNQYGDFIRQVDLGLCLMYTPHPSYPPLDLAASGAVVVTNTCGNKQDLKMYSDNIISVNLDVDSLLDGLKSGVQLVNNHELRELNYKNNKLLTNWEQSFANVLEQLV
ncbi:MAG: hypothetical protein K0R14_1359 [Burkholderiales bacterium]|jgi:hypothetical protein|nr:hypothetical protein [Burkholderiales bacterium]